MAIITKKFDCYHIKERDGSLDYGFRPQFIKGIKSWSQSFEAVAHDSIDHVCELSNLTNTEWASFGSIYWRNHHKGEYINPTYIRNIAIMKRYNPRRHDITVNQEMPKIYEKLLRHHVFHEFSANRIHVPKIYSKEEYYNIIVHLVRYGYYGAESFYNQLGRSKEELIILYALIMESVKNLFYNTEEGTGEFYVSVDFDKFKVTSNFIENNEPLI